MIFVSKTEMRIYTSKFCIHFFQVWTRAGIDRSISIGGFGENHGQFFSPEKYKKTFFQTKFVEFK